MDMSNADSTNWIIYNLPYEFRIFTLDICSTECCLAVDLIKISLLLPASLLKNPLLQRAQRLQTLI